MAAQVEISVAGLAAEAGRLARKLARAPATVAGIGEPEFGTSAKDEVWRDGKVALYRYRRDTPATAPAPLLIAYALVNRPYMVDLQPDRSLVRNLLARGHEVYLIDWGYPDAGDRWLDLDDYILRFLGGAVGHLRAAHRVEAIDLLGICQGGSFSLCYASLFPERIRRLATMVTPVDFHTADNLLSHWTRGLDVEAFVEAQGNIPAELMNWAYLTLKPWRLFVHKYVALADVLDDAAETANFLRMERWIFDSPDQAGEAFRQFITQFYQRNGLVRGGIRLGGRAVDLKNVRMPVLNIYAEQDHLVPPSASKPLRGLVGSRDYSEYGFPGGHIGIYVSARAQREVPDTLDAWLRRA